MRIGVFDSGVGGLSVLAAIHSALPVHELIYCCDYLNLPYGTKPDDMVINCAKAVTKKFFEAAKPDILVIACNTVSTVALQDIRKMLPIPVVGVVPAIKPAAERSGTKTIGLLATPATIKRAYTADLIRDFAADCHVLLCGSSELVLMAERKLRGEPVTDDLVRREVQPLLGPQAEGMDQLVLGCTHFPLLADELRRVFPPTVAFVDSGSAIAQRVEVLCQQMGHHGAVPVSKPVAPITGWCSGPPMTINMPNQLGQLHLQSLP